MGQTIGGLPWPEDTDPVMAGAQAIRALAESLDRLYFHAERLASFAVGGGGTDVTVGAGNSVAAWETIESNFAPTLVGPGPPIGSSGFVIPAGAAGLWAFVGNAAYSGATLTACRVTCIIIDNVSGKEVGTQNLEGGGGNVFRTVNASGLMRLAVGASVRMTVSQNSGSSLTFGSGTAPGTRFTTRFSAWRLAP